MTRPAVRGRLQERLQTTTCLLPRTSLPFSLSRSREEKQLATLEYQMQI